MGVALCSIFENKKDGYKIDVYVLDGGIKEDNKNKLKILEDRYNFKINYITIDTSFFKDLYISEHITQATYYRIMIPELIPNIQKILYLDCDIIANNDIKELYDINIDNYFFAAIEEKDEFTINRIKKLELPINSKYFNAGVMLINIKKWKQSNSSKDIINFIKKNKDKFENCYFIAWDQDALNAIMYDKWLNISFKYNYIESFLRIYPLEIANIEDKILIIHYTNLKPWNYLCLHPLRNLYFYYLNKTPWFYNKYKDKNLKKMMIKFIELIIIFIFKEKIIKNIKLIKRKLKIKFY